MRISALQVILLFSFSNLFSQSHEVSYNITPAYKNYSGNYFYNFKNNLSFGSTFGFQSMYFDNKCEGYYFSPELRLYPNKSGNSKGWFVGIWFRYRNIKYKDPDDVYEWLFDKNVPNEISLNEYIYMSTISLGLGTGWEWVFEFGLTIQVWLRMGQFIDGKITYLDKEMNPYGFPPKTDATPGLSLGWRFGSGNK